jgi:hypothetical protein
MRASQQIARRALFHEGKDQRAGYGVFPGQQQSAFEGQCTSAVVVDLGVAVSQANQFIRFAGDVVIVRLVPPLWTVSPQV